MARYAKTARMFRIMEMLRNARGGLHIDRIARDLECSTRTVRRYLEAIQSETLYPIYSEKTDRGRIWKLVEDCRQTPLIPLSLEEAAAMIMARKILAPQGKKSPLADAFDSLLKKLKDQRDPDFRRFLDEIDSAIITAPAQTVLPVDSVPSFQAIIDAIRKKRKLRFDYEDLGKKITRGRTVAPLAFFIAAGRIYLVAHCYLRGAIRQFVPDRIRNLETLDQRFRKDFDFDPEEFAQSSFGVYHAEPETILLRISGGMMGGFSRVPVHPTQELSHKDGKFYLRIRIGPSSDLIRWISQFGPDAEVIEPIAVRHRVAEYHAKAAEQHR